MARAGGPEGGGGFFDSLVSEHVHKLWVPSSDVHLSGAPKGASIEIHAPARHLEKPAEPSAELQFPMAVGGGIWKWRWRGGRSRE